MKERPLEPGLLNTFRQYVAIRLGIMLLGLLRLALPAGPVPMPEFQPLWLIPIIADAALFALLMVRAPERIFGRYFLPTALLVAVVIQMLYARWYSGPFARNQILIGYFGQLILVLVPVILAAWQYRFRFVVGYSLVLASLQVATIITLPEFEPLQQMDGFLFGVLFLAQLAVYLFVGYIVSKLVAAQRAQRQELADANRKLVDYALTVERLSVSRERNRLARELHDTLAHTLSGLTVQLDALASLWQPDTQRARQILDHSLTTAREGLNETRRVLQALRAAPLDDLGLTLGIGNLAETAAARGSLALELDVDEHIAGLSPEDEQGFYRVAQEALANVVEHAQARKVTVSLTRQAEQLVLRVADDGRGLPSNPHRLEQGLGLQGMRERAELMGGKLKIGDSREGGTEVTLSKELAR
jgi:signal transduction histidine kinase